MKIIVENVPKKDVGTLIKWWNGHTKFYHFKQKILCRYRGGRWKYVYDIVRQD